MNEMKYDDWDFRPVGIPMYTEMTGNDRLRFSLGALVLGMASGDWIYRRLYTGFTICREKASESMISLYVGINDGVNDPYM